MAFEVKKAYYVYLLLLLILLVYKVCHKNSFQFLKNGNEFWLNELDESGYEI